MVVGGGIGGLAAGLALSRGGWQVSVLERSPETSEIGAGLTLVRNAMVALDALGVASTIRAGGRTESSFGTRTSTGRWLWRFDAATVSDQLGSSTLGIHRATLARILAEALPAGALRSGADVVRLTIGGPKAPAEVSYVEQGRPVQLAADLVVAADGLRSRVRSQLWLTTPPVYVGSTAWRAVTHRRWTRDLEAAISWGPGSEFGSVPLGDGRVYWYGATKAPRGERSHDEMAEVRSRFGSWHDPIPDLLDATKPSDVLRHDLYQLDAELPSYVSGRVALLGDAAHAMPPYLGQGAAQALEDAAVLGVCVPADADVMTALARYDAKRRPRSQQIARLSRRVGRCGQQLSHPAAVGSRNIAMRLLPPRLLFKSTNRLTDWAPPAAVQPKGP